MNKKLTGFALGAAMLGMGLSMPSCPGQQAMQEQLETLKTGQADSNKKIQALDAQLKKMNGDVDQMKALVSQVSNAVLAQKMAIENMDAALKALQTKPAGKKRK